ncbi:hypothetical protein H6G06_20275 [Anabaena sphaerica FACHB-251]|uniref:Uncharacterized protein n=1 Tax=Anabaena sphaerica FACHB-251 TaxID=2692883 RepID=A0A927A2V0_9NOST|nr:hypothetical protein [Anabaena sphaerica]MBD2295748.1 hypothetical protein [Anabaena sphaerica FACHB-251]
MTTQSALNEVAKNLEQHENSTRIKKLIYCACTNNWQNDQDILDRFKLTELIQELYSFNPTIEHLNYTFYQIVNTLSKPREYSLVANIILNEIEKLYVINEEFTGIIFNQPYPQESTGIIFNQPQQEISSNPLDEFTGYQIKYEYNKFDLRQNIMQYTNPLRAKLVLFFAFYNKIDFLEEDWNKLRAEELDGLLEKVFDSCATIRELESKLNNAVISLGNQYEDSQAAGAIMQSMQGFYGDISSNQDQYQPPKKSSSEETSTITNAYHQITSSDDDSDIYENDKDSTCQLIAPPTPYPFNKKQ